MEYVEPFGEREEVFYRDEILVAGDYSDLRVESFIAVNSCFRGCSFRRALIGEACFGAGARASTYVECDFDEARIVASSPGVARFERCTFRNVKLQSWFCQYVEFVDCVFSGHLRKAYFNATVPKDLQGAIKRSRNEFKGNDLSGLRLSDVGFRTGIDLSRQRLPSGPEYLYLPRARGAVEFAAAEVDGWKEDATKRTAEGLLGVLRHELIGGQEQLFLNLRDAPSSSRPTAKLVFELLARYGATP